MPRLARWDDSFEFEDVPELIEMFRSGSQMEWIEEDPRWKAGDCFDDCLSDDQLGELVLDLKSRAERAKRSPVPNTANN